VARRHRTAIQTGNADKAAQSMIAITERALVEMSTIWDRDGDTPTSEALTGAS